MDQNIVLVRIAAVPRYQSRAAHAGQGQRLLDEHALDGVAAGRQAYIARNADSRLQGRTVVGYSIATRAQPRGSTEPSGTKRNSFPSIAESPASRSTQVQHRIASTIHGRHRVAHKIREPGTRRRPLVWPSRPQGMGTQEFPARRLDRHQPRPCWPLTRNLERTSTCVAKFQNTRGHILPRAAC
jgi:hypothetical protein